MSRSGAMVAAIFVLCACVQGMADEGILNLGPQEFVQAGGNDIVVPGYSVPSFEDWNNDGLRDLIVGEGGNNYTGKVRVYLNAGVESDPCFVDYFYAQADGVDLTCVPSGCQGCFPRVVYWDDDDRKDLMVGQSDGTVKIFLNITDNNEPAFDAGTLLRVRNDMLLNVGGRATPTLVDWNDDGHLDIIVGSLGGEIHIYENCGCDGGWVPPRFLTSSPDGYPFARENGHDLIVPGKRSSPEFADLDGDGRKDLLVGTTGGLILFYKNIGTPSLPEFAPYTSVQSMGTPIDLPDTLRSRPSLCHWTGDGKFGPKDGYWDLLVGYGDGKVRLYRGLPKAGDFDLDGTLDGDDFGFLAKALDKPVPAEGTPADLNGDGVVDTLDLRLFADLWLAANK